MSIIFSADYTDYISQPYAGLALSEVWCAGPS